MLIGEVSRRSGVSTRMLRHYDRLGLVTPTGRTTGGYREYAPDDVRRLFHVESLRTLGLSLQEVGRALDEPGFVPADLVRDLVRHTRRRIAAEEELLARLEHVDAAAPTGWDEVLGVVTLLRALDSESSAHRQQAVLTSTGAVPAPAIVEAALAENDLNVAGALRWSLARTAGHGLGELSAGLASESAEIRRRAVDTIADLRTAEATDLLHLVLDDPDDTVRTRAAILLGGRGGVDAVPVLVASIVAGHNDVEAAETLGLLTAVAIPAADVVATLQHALDASADPSVRLRITQAFAEIPGAAAAEALTRLTRDGDRTIAATAAAILALLQR
ncbi:MerR family transcriptional regulator [Prescottella sp. R16]|uniref:MerR family transcriptional regulator n=1 Tax=Prescottella sp. R16 TaxID=3064529 RepID=UPI00272E14AD|nr:MerR family transcriptional regulator [Prescottella sp. R16]